jgi:hypothetical protein
MFSLDIKMKAGYLAWAVRLVPPFPVVIDLAWPIKVPSKAEAIIPRVTDSILI